MEEVGALRKKYIESEHEDISMDMEKESMIKNKGNPRLADALAKVIRMSRTKKCKHLVLSKAKLYSSNSATLKEKNDFEIEPDPNIKIEKNTENLKDNNEDKKPDRKLLKNMALKKHEKIRRGRLKPSPLDRDKEKPLIKIATRGVVQLFNAVRQQQSAINKEINKPGITEAKKEKILKSIDKKTFLEVLKGKIKTSTDVINNLNEEMKSEHESEPSWQVLRDDFMMGTKLKDWDKKEIEIEE